MRARKNDVLPASPLMGWWMGGRKRVGSGGGGRTTPASASIAVTWGRWKVGKERFNGIEWLGCLPKTFFAFLFFTPSLSRLFAEGRAINAPESDCSIILTDIVISGEGMIMLYQWISSAGGKANWHAHPRASPRPPALRSTATHLIPIWSSLCKAVGAYARRSTTVQLSN